MNIRLSAILLVLGAVALARGEAGLPLDLERAVSLALENNYSIRKARALHDEAAGVVVSAGAGRLPAVALDAGYSRVDSALLHDPTGRRMGETQAWSTRLIASQALCTGGALRASVRSSRESAESAEAAWETAVRETVFEVRVRFYAVLLARERVGVQEQAVGLLEEELANARSRVRAGSGSPFEQLRAEVELANGQPSLIRARNDYRLAAVELLRVIGLSAQEDSAGRVEGSLGFSGRELDLEALLLGALSARPEIRSLEHRVAAAESLVHGAGAGARPTVSVFGGYELAKSGFSSDLAETVHGWTAGVQGTWAVFDGRETRGRVRQARARLDQARLDLAETRLAIEAEVRQAFSSYQEARELVRASQKVVEQAEESLRLARSRYGAGAGTQLDVLQSQVALTEARLNEAQALFEANVADARVLRVAVLEELPPGVVDRSEP